MINYKINTTIKISILIIIIIVLFLFIRKDNIYYENEYILDGYFYTKNKKELLTGIVKYIYDHPYSTYEFKVVNGLVAGNYKVYADFYDKELLEDNFYISDSLFLNKVKKIIGKDKISVYYDNDYESVCYTINIYVKDIQSRKVELDRMDYYTEYAKEVLNLINVEQSQIAIEFVFGDNLVYMYRDYGYLFFYKNRQLEYYFINKDKYKIVGDSAVYVP